MQQNLLLQLQFLLLQPESPPPPQKKQKKKTEKKETMIGSVRLSFQDAPGLHPGYGRLLCENKLSN